MRIFIRLVLTVFLIAIVQTVQAEDCTFVGGGIKEPQLPRDLVHLKYWDDETKEFRAILKSGELMYVSYSHCNHFGMEAHLILTNSEYDPKELAQSADRLASLLLTKKDLGYFRKGVHGQSLKLGANLSIIHDEYDDFGIRLTAQGSVTIITISYYFT